MAQVIISDSLAHVRYLTRCMVKKILVHKVLQTSLLLKKMSEKEINNMTKLGLLYLFLISFFNFFKKKFHLLLVGLETYVI